MTLLETARKLKHYISKKRRKHLRPWEIKAFDLWRRGASNRTPYIYDQQHYAHTFLTRPTPATGHISSAPRRIFVIWVGDTPMNNRRSASLESIHRANPGIQVEFIDESSWGKWLIPDAPVHQAFDLLTPIQKSDYMRAYLMHFHGGGYCDIKPVSADWTPLFQSLNSDPETWALGYREITSEYTPDLPRILGKDLKRHYRSVFGPSAFIFKPRTPFTEEWWRELTSRMDYYAAALAESPGRDSYDRSASYPIRWTEIAGDIIQPLCLKHQTHIRFDDVIRPQLHGYRS